MEVFGDHIGVNLRGASTDLVHEFMMRSWFLVAEGGKRFYRVHGSMAMMSSAEQNDVMDEAALQAVRELFGGAKS